jgi:VWFA-related protein
MQVPSGMMASAAAALLLAGGGLAHADRQVRPAQPPTFRSGIEVVSIDVGVVDRQGQPLRGLGPGDFTVSVGGQPRRVVSAEFVDVAGAQAHLKASSDSVPVSTNEGGGIGRLFVFIVDQSTLDPGSARNVARAASRFFPRLTFSDRSALMLMPVGQGVGFTWAHDRVRDALQRVSGMSSPINTWEFGSLAEARDIANRNGLALRSVGERECRTSPFAGGGGGGGGGGGILGGPTAPGQGGAPGTAPPAGGNTPGGGAGGGGTPSGGGATGTGTRQPRTGSSTGFGGDACMSNIQMQAESTWRIAEMTSMSSLSSLRQMLGALGRVRGDKTIILISGGWPMDDREETSTMSTVAAEAAAARATVFTIFVPVSSFSADRRMVSSAPSRDQFLHSGPLETLAGMTGGGTFRAEVNAEAAFDRLGRELAGFYRVGVEKNPSDLAAKARHMKVQVARSGVTVRARELFDVRTYEDRDWAARLASAIDAPIPATSVGLRVTSYLAPDPEDGTRFKLVIAGEASRLQPGEATFQLVLRDMEGRKVLSGDQPLGEAAGSVMPFSTSIPVAPGSYIVRLAVMDGEGRVGSVDHRVEARAVTLGSLAGSGPVLVRVPSGPDPEPRVALDGVQQDERLALEVGLEAASGQLTAPEIVFEIAATAGGPALVRAPAALSRGSREGSIIAQAVTDMRVLPPGPYFARAMVSSGGEPVGELRRAFTVIGAPHVAADTATASPVPAARTASAPLMVRGIGTVKPFALDDVLAPPILGVFLDRVAARADAASPAVRELLERARTAGPASLAVPDASGDETAVAAFVRGLALLSQKKLDPAASAFRSAMRDPDFYPAMVYLGACYAAGGNDKEAAGAWRTALIREGDAVALHVLLADALLRQDKGDLALQTVDGARARWPQDDTLKRRFVVAALMSGKQAEGLRAVDELLEANAADEPSLALALLALYDAFVGHRPIESVEEDRRRMIRLADAYRARGGPSLALVDTWVAAAARKQ